MFRRLASLTAVTLLVALVASGCGRKHSDPVDVSVNPADVPPVPTDMALALSGGEIALFWSVVNADTVGLSYNVYKAVGPEDMGYYATTTERTYVDDRVVNGTSYSYQVAASRNSLEGERSQTVSGTPSTFAIVLEGGAAATAASSFGVGTRTVRVDLVAPASTETFRLSEDPGLSGATLRSFQPDDPTTTFVLSPNDGPKVIYCAFAVLGGSVSEVVSSTVRLDTRAIISQVTEDSGGSPLGINDVLHLTLTADTTGGTATADIGQVYQDVLLFDDGTNGDASAFDGVYERDYVITAGGEVLGEPVVGRFRDDVGNVANAVNSATMVTVADPPAAVALNPAAFTIVGTNVTLAWSESTANDFEEYRLYRSPPNQSATVDETDELVVSMTDRAQRSYTDANLVAGAEYRWGLVVVDDAGFRSPFDTAVVSAAFDPVISQATLTPVGGPPGTTFTCGCTYTHPQGLGPSSVALVVDQLVTYPMIQVGAGTNWTGGEAFTVDLALGLGSHTFHFQAIAMDGSQAVAPTGGTYGGPVVTE